MMFRRSEGLLQIVAFGSGYSGRDYVDGEGFCPRKSVSDTAVNQ